MTKADFISRVMQIMNELGWDDASSGAFFGGNTTDVEKHIEAVFVDAWRKATSLFPKYYFAMSDFTSSTPVADTTTGTGYVLLPSDFYMLFSFKMSGWQKRVETLHLSSDPIASVQANDYTRGNIARPVVIRTTKATTSGLKEVLEYYSLEKGVVHTVGEAIYIPLIGLISDAIVGSLNDKLIDPLAYLCASLVFNIFEKTEIAKVLETKATELIN